MEAGGCGAQAQTESSCRARKENEGRGRGECGRAWACLPEVRKGWGEGGGAPASLLPPLLWCHPERAAPDDALSQ